MEAEREMRERWRGAEMRPLLPVWDYSHKAVWRKQAGSARVFEKHFHFHHKNLQEQIVNCVKCTKRGSRLTCSHSPFSAFQIPLQHI